MKTLPDESVNLCITSPPYWGLRDYGVEGQIGLEPDFRDYVRKLVRIFVELQRVLKDDGSFYLNLGDSYSHSGGAGTQYHRLKKNKPHPLKYKAHKAEGLPPKCLVGIPWRVALALIRKGWALRNAIIWHKPNSLPSSVKDRLTCTYEHVFHFVKSRKYYYNLDAIRVPHKVVGVTDLRPPGILRQRLYQHGKYSQAADAHLKQYQNNHAGNHKNDMLTMRETALVNFFRQKGSGGNPGHGIQGSTLGSTHPRGKNPGDVYHGKLAVNSEQYGSPRARRMRKNHENKDYHPNGKNPGDVLTTVHDVTRPKADGIMKTGGMMPPPNVHRENPDRVWNPRGKNPGDFWIINTRGFKGAHFAVYPEELLIRPILSSSRVGDVVLDPFIGSGTTAVVAKKLGRRFLGCDINHEYVKMAEERLISGPASWKF